jgi:hypothetical protein
MRGLLLIGMLVLAQGCASIKVTDYSGNEPQLDIEAFFDGQLTAHGVVKDRGGKVIRYFNAEIDAHWTDGIGTLDEHFVFDDGETQRRVWTLKPTGDGRYAGSAGDVVGEGRLEQAGNSVFLDYVLRIPYRGQDVDVKVDDRMYLVSPDILINESRLSKWGLHVGTLLLVIERRPVVTGVPQ